MERLLFLSILGFATLATVAGCGTLVFGSKANIEVTSLPIDSKVEIYRAEWGEEQFWRYEDGRRVSRYWIMKRAELEPIFEGTTPTLVELPRSGFYLIEIESPGFQRTRRAICPRTFSAWIWGNALTGFLPGMAVDWLSGGMWEYADGHYVGLPEDGEVAKEVGRCDRRFRFTDWLDGLEFARDQASST